MKKHPVKFYTDFEFFIAEVTIELQQQGKLGSAWLKAIGGVLGIHVLAKILLNELKIALPVVLPGIGAISTGYKMQAAIEKSIEQLRRSDVKYDENEEKHRLKKAQIIFQELAGNEMNEDKIDLLFEDFVSEEEIIY